MKVRAAALLAVALLGGCGEPPTPGSRLIVFAVDGADWDSAIPLMHQGKLPTLARIVRTGARRTLRSLDGDRLSPTIWTTVATGVLPERHGIRHFVEMFPRGPSPVTSNIRQVAALWNILTARDRTVGVLGWLVTWPAEPVNGYVVSSYVPYVFDMGGGRPIKGTFVDGVPHQTWPTDLQEELEKYKVAPASVADEDLRDRFLGRAIPDSLSDDVRKSLEAMRWSWASDATYEGIFHHLASNPVGGAPPDLEMVYFGSVDVVSHRFWKYKEPGTYSLARLDPGEIELYGASVENAYRSVDGVLARVLSRQSEAIRLLLLSDHGFRESRDTDPMRSRRADRLSTSSGWHRPQGALVACGPGFRAGVVLEEGSVVDVTPTVLYALGLPVAADMDGRPAFDLFDEDFRARTKELRIDSYEPEVAILRQQAPIVSPVDDEVLQRLKALGYID